MHIRERPWKPTQCKLNSPTQIPEVKENVDTDLSPTRNLHRSLGKGTKAHVSSPALLKYQHTIFSGRTWATASSELDVYNQPSLPPLPGHISHGLPLAAPPPSRKITVFFETITNTFGKNSLPALSPIHRLNLMCYLSFKCLWNEGTIIKEN